MVGGYISGSLLAQAVTSTTGGVGTLATITGLLVCFYIVYQVLAKKNREIAKKVIGLRGLTPAIILAIMAFIPATAMAVFGPAEAFVTAIFSVLIAAFVGYIAAWGILYICDLFQPEILPD